MKSKFYSMEKTAEHFNMQCTKPQREKRFNQKLSMLLSVVAHTQNIADQTKELADGFMTEEEQSYSDVMRVIENLSCVCEEALSVIVEQITKKR